MAVGTTGVAGTIAGAMVQHVPRQVQHPEPGCSESPELLATGVAATTAAASVADSAAAAWWWCPVAGAGLADGAGAAVTGATAECMGHANSPAGSMSAVANQTPQRAVSVRNQSGRRIPEAYVAMAKWEKG